MKLCKFIKALEMAKIVTRCSVVIILVASQKSTEGEGVSRSEATRPIDCELFDPDRVSSEFFRTNSPPPTKAAASSSKVIKLNDLSFGIGIGRGGGIGLVGVVVGAAEKLKAARFGGNMTKKWEPREMRPKAIGYLGLRRLSLSANSLSRFASIDHT